MNYGFLRSRGLSIAVTVVGVLITLASSSFFVFSWAPAPRRAQASGARPLRFDAPSEVSNLLPLEDSPTTGSKALAAVDAERADLEFKLEQATAAFKESNGSADARTRLEAATAEYRALTSRVDALAARSKRYGLRREQIVYNRPASLPFGEPSRITASVASASLEDARESIRGAAGPVKVVSKLVAPKVRAELTGPESLIQIQSQTVTTRLVSEAGNASWNWYVTPKSTEPIELRLSFYNIVSAEGITGETTGPVFTDTFIVNATGAQRLKSTLTDLQPYYAIIAGFFTTAAGLLLWFRNWIPKKAPVQNVVLSKAGGSARQPRTRR